MCSGWLSSTLVTNRHKLEIPLYFKQKKKKKKGKVQVTLSHVVVLIAYHFMELHHFRFLVDPFK